MKKLFLFLLICVSGYAQTNSTNQITGAFGFKLGDKLPLTCFVNEDSLGNRSYSFKTDQFPPFTYGEVLVTSNRVICEIIADTRGTDQVLNTLELNAVLKQLDATYGPRRLSKVRGHEDPEHIDGLTPYYYGDTNRLITLTYMAPRKQLKISYGDEALIRQEMQEKDAAASRPVGTNH